MEIIHGQYLKGFLLSQNRKKCTIEEVFYWEIQIIVICKQILMLQSYRVSGSKVMWSEIIWVALQSEDCFVNTGGDSLFITKNETHLLTFNWKLLLPGFYGIFIVLQ